MTRKFEGADQESLDLLKRMKESGIESSFDRYDAQQPQCGYGKIGLCCRHCQMGPCNVDPFGKGPQKGVCGAMQTRLRQGILSVMLLPVLLHILIMAGQLPSFS